MTTDAKLLAPADVERGMRATVLNGLAESKEDLPDLPKHVRYAGLPPHRALSSYM